MIKKKILLILDTTTEYGRGIYSGISQYISERRHWQVYRLTDFSDEAFQQVQLWNPSGIIVRTSNERVLAFVRTFSVGVLNLDEELGSDSKEAGLSLSVRTDERTTAELAVCHFLEQGIRNLAFYGTGRSRTGTVRGEQFEKAVKKYEVSFVRFYEKSSILNPPFDPLPAEGARLCDWLAGQTKPIGIWTPNDWTAQRVMYFCNSRRYKIPTEISVLGTGNELPICLMSDPSLSSIDLASEKIGYQGSALLDRLLNRDETMADRSILLPPGGVVARGSTDILTVTNPDVVRIIQYIRINAIHGITVADVQKEFDLIPRTLQRLMKRYWVRTTESEIRRTRIEYAKDLLAKTALSLSQTAEQSGFGSTAYFMKVFKEETGVTPDRFRVEYSSERSESNRTKFDRNTICVKPLAERRSVCQLKSASVNPLLFPVDLDSQAWQDVERTAEDIHRSREAGASRILVFGAHLIMNGLARILIRLMEGGWITFFATDGAGIIHDWEYAFQGATGEDVRKYTAEGQYGIWNETGMYINLALVAGAWQGLGYGESIGRLIEEEGLNIPTDEELLEAIVARMTENRSEVAIDRAAAAADFLSVKKHFNLKSGFLRVAHPYREFSLACQTRLNGVPFTCHPMFGHDVIYTHPMNKGAAVGRTAESDFLSFVDAVSHLEGGVYLSVGSSVMSPMIFGKALSMARNVSLRKGKSFDDFSIHVVDLVHSDWDWNQDVDPPEGDPAANLRFCRMFSRMGGRMNYCGADCRSWLTALLRILENDI